MDMWAKKCTIIIMIIIIIIIIIVIITIIIKKGNCSSCMMTINMQGTTCQNLEITN